MMLAMMLHPGHGAPAAHFHAEPFAIFMLIVLVIVGATAILGDRQ